MEMAGGGVLELQQTGGQVKFTAERGRDDRGLYKVWLRGRAEKTCLLGTLIPEGQQLRLNRTLSVKELEQRGCWPVEGAEVRLAYAFGQQKNDGWTVISRLPDTIGDELLRRSLRGRVLYKQGEEGRCLLAAPFRTDCPVALEPLICLGRGEQVEGKLCLVWAFDGQGRPEPPASSPAR